MAADGASGSASARRLDEPTKALVRRTYDALQTATPGFQKRVAQLQMIGGVSRALGTTGGCAVIEAGTGTGKSLAYLTTGVPLALETGKKLVISTGTVALQEQLVGRDIPAFLKNTGLTAKVALGKGRQRFLCVRNLMDLHAPAEASADMFDVEAGAAAWPNRPTSEQVALVERLADSFSSGAWNGDMDAIEEIPYEVRRLVTTTSGGCAGNRCPHASVCPALISRRELREANVVVVNHSLLMADLLMDDADGARERIVADPESDLFVFDEAHQLATRAIEAAAAHISIESMLQRITRARKVVAAGARALRTEAKIGERAARLGERLDSLANSVVDLRVTISGQWTPDHSEREPTWRAPMGELPEEWTAVAGGLASELGKILGGLNGLRKDIGDSALADALKSRQLKELGIIIEQFEADDELFSLWGSPGRVGAPVAKWVVLNAQGGFELHASPVDAAPIVTSALWSKAESVVLTSATMGSGHDFTAFAEGLGLPEHAEIMKLDSPFDLEGQAELQVPWMPALPSDHQGHCQAIADWLEKDLDWDKGTLVLFTSKRKLNDTLALLGPERKTRVLAQGTLPKQRLLLEHQKAIEAGKGSVIFGSASFGEGVDLCGDLLTTVVITQLPFSVPTDPIGATLAEWYEANRRNPFMELAIPETIRILTQYCGRLIRTVTDRGRICILDRRLIEKRYGSSILEALPPFRRSVARRPRT